MSDIPSAGTARPDAAPSDERIMRDIAARLNAVGIKADVIEVPQSALSPDLNIHDVLAELSQLRRENWKLLEQIDALLAHPVMAARQLRAERAASAAVAPAAREPNTETNDG